MAALGDAGIIVLNYLKDLFSGLLSRLLVALIILLTGFILGRLVERLAGRLLHEVELDAVLQKAGIKMPLEHTLSMVLAYLIYFIVIVMALNHIGLATVVLYIIVGGAILIIIIATLLGIKDFIPNFIAGFFIFRKEPFKPGQTITFAKVEGVVQNITMLETELKTKKGDRIHIPNSLILKEVVKVKKTGNKH